VQTIESALLLLLQDRHAVDQGCCLIHHEDALRLGLVAHVLVDFLRIGFGGRVVHVLVETAVSAGRLLQGRGGLVRGSILLQLKQ
jgi:hypothetical protein